MESGSTRSASTWSAWYTTVLAGSASSTSGGWGSRGAGPHILGGLDRCERPGGRGRGGHHERAGGDDPHRSARYGAARGAGPDQGRDRQQWRGVAAAEDHGRALPGQPAQAGQLVRLGDTLYVPHLAYG